MGQEPAPVTTTSDDPDAIRRDIADTRGEMEGTLEAINDRVNPQRVYERRSGRARNRWQSLRSSVMGSSDSSSSSTWSSSSSSRTSSSGSGGPDVSGRTQQAKQAISDAPDQMERKARGNPLAAGLIAFGLGALVGSALPESDAERAAAREAADRLDLEGTKQRLTEHARDVQASVQGQARDAAQDVKGSAQDAAQDVKGQAQQEGQRVQQEGQQSKQRVQEQS